MKKNILSSLIVPAAIMIVISLLAVCSLLDVVGKDSIRALDELMKIIPPGEDGNHWAISAPDGGAHFLWNGTHVALKIDATPFIAAGLDGSKYPYFRVIDGAPFIVIRCFETGLCKIGDSGEKTTPVADYENIVNTNRRVIQYHFERDHHAVVLRDNMFKWAKDFHKIDATGAEQKADIVFVLDPKPLIAAGVDTSAGVEGWRFGVFEMMGSNTERFTKPFNLM